MELKIEGGKQNRNSNPVTRQTERVTKQGEEALCCPSNEEHQCHGEVGMNMKIVEPKLIRIYFSLGHEPLLVFS